MSGSSFDWADDVIDEAEMLQKNAPIICKNEITLHDLMVKYDGVPNSSVASLHEERQSDAPLIDSSDEDETNAISTTPEFCPELSPEPEDEQIWTSTKALAQGRFHEWTNYCVWNINEGCISYREVFLPKHLAGWRGAKLPSTPKPADNHLAAIDPIKLLSKMPYLERSYMGCLTYQSFAHRASQQKSMRKFGIVEKEVPLSDSDKLKVVFPSFSRWVCQPTGMRNSWTMV